MTCCVSYLDFRPLNFTLYALTFSTYELDTLTVYAVTLVDACFIVYRYYIAFVDHRTYDYLLPQMN